MTSAFQLMHDDGAAVIVSVARPKTNGTRAWNNYQFTSSQQAMKFLRKKNDEGLDAYIKHATFDGATEPRGAHQVPVCNVANVIGSRTFVLDIDAHGSSPYKTPADALRAFGQTFKAMQEKVPLPTPNIMQMTGHGAVVGWATDELIAKPEWDELTGVLFNLFRQYGLEHDNGMKPADRGIRVCGGTFQNHKSSPPVPTKIVHLGQSRIPAKRLRDALAPYKSLLVIQGGAAEKADPGVNAEFAISGQEYHFNLTDVAEDCVVLRDAFVSAGAGASYPEWANLIAMAARHHDETEGRRLAHLMSSGHAGYDPQLTDDKFDSFRGSTVKAFVTCKTFEVSGPVCKAACETCAFRGKVVSPAGIPKVKREAKVKDLPPLPNDMFYNSANGLMARNFSTEPGANDYKVLTSVVSKVELFEDHGSHQAVLSLQLDAPSGDWSREIAVSVNGMSDVQSTRRLLSQVGITLNDTAGRGIHNAMVSWVDTLRDRKKAQTSYAAMGWTPDHNFVIGDTVYTPTGVRKTKAVAGRAAYGPHGDKLRMDAAIAGVMQHEKRPEAHALIATSVAAPMLALTGHSGISLNFWSAKSGFGKSTLLDVAASLWGTPGALKVGVDDTSNALIAHLASMHNFPAYFDELRVLKPQDFFNSVIFRLPHGVEKRRLTADAKERPVREWRTILTFCTNYAMAGGMGENQAHGDAASARFLDLEMPPLPAGSEKSAVVISQLTNELREHNGHIAPLVAAELTANKLALTSTLQHVANTLMKHTTTGTGDVSGRIHAAAGACLIVAAQMMSSKGWVPVDPKLVTKAVLNALKGGKEVRKTAQKRIGHEDILADFMQRYEASRLIVTSTAKGAKFLSSDHPMVARPVVYEVDTFTKKLTVDMRMLAKFLAEQGLPVQDIIGKLGGYTNSRMGLGAGTDYRTGARDVIEIDVKGTRWESLADK